MSGKLARGTRLTLGLPDGFVLAKAVCSYGYFLLAPNHWEVEVGCFTTCLRVGKGVRVRVVVSEGRDPGRLVVACDRRLDRGEQSEVKRQLGRVLRLGEDLSGWWKIHTKARREGFGRLFRSPTLWEDIVKTITGCNTTWTSTIRMNRLLVERVGKGGFPTPSEVCRYGARRLKERCKVGYRAERIVGVARAILEGRLVPSWFESSERSAEEVEAALRELNGIGPYAAANICQLLGFYDYLAIDSETYRHFCEMKGVARPEKDKVLDPLIEAHYEPMRPYRFLAYWYDLWRAYEQRVGPAEGWVRERDAERFTASKLRQDLDSSSLVSG